MKVQLVHSFEKIASVENLLEAWKEFLPGKRNVHDVQEFQLRLMDTIFSLHDDLVNYRYRHGGYRAFNVSDPKPRNIHKASVCDRLLHHALHRILYPFFDRTFISDTFSCRVGKGTHAAINRFRSLSYIVSKNHTRTCWVLKCDIRKFFANIDHAILLDILRSYISDPDTLWLLEKVIKSFSSGVPSRGLPLGNLTSQLFANIYMNEFDQFAKHTLKAHYYMRYADDFVILSDSQTWLGGIIPGIEVFLREHLKLALHPDKVFIKTIASGIDFLGWVQFLDHHILRTSTKRRMMKRIAEHPTSETIASYRGLLSHGNTHRIKAGLFG